MKTRNELYGQEASELLRTISLYPGLCEGQLCGFFPGRGEKIKNLLSYFCRQGRARKEGDSYFPHTDPLPEKDAGLTRAVWVLLDFIDRAEFHSPGDFPVKIAFFAGGELYEVIYAAPGQEALVSHALSREKESGARRIVLVDGTGQIPLLNFPGITGFCTTDSRGHTSYYKKSNGGKN